MQGQFLWDTEMADSKSVTVVELSVSVIQIDAVKQERD